MALQPWMTTLALDGGRVDIDEEDVAGEPKEIEIAVFARVNDKKLDEWRMVVDLTIFNELRVAAGLPILD